MAGITTPSREKIKDQMVKTAARLWNIQENEIEANFDPLVLLLIDACAAELEKIGHRISGSHQRLVERLAELLVPDAASNTYPASCIMQANSASAYSNITPKHKFTHSHSNSSHDNFGKKWDSELNFSSIGDFKLLGCSLAYYISGQSVYRNSPKRRRELVHSQKGGSSDSIWLALSIEEGCENLKDLQMCFNLRSYTHADAFYYALSQSTGTCGNTPIELKTGYNNSNQFEMDPINMLTQGHNYIAKVQRQIANTYRNRFLHIAHDCSSVPNGIPTALEWLPDGIKKSMESEKLVFIQIKMNHFFSQDIFDGLSCDINAFPIVNMQLNQIQYKTQDWINIIPLSVKGSFVDLANIQSSANHKYHFRYTSGRNQPEEGEAVLRKSGVGLLSGSEVQEITDNLIESIRDQHAFFTEIRNESIINRLRDITAILARIREQMVTNTMEADASTYLLLRPVEAGDLLTVEYYTSYAEIAHHAKLYDSLKSVSHSVTKPDSEIIISQVTGGHSDLTTQDKIAHLKKQLLGRGNILSIEDVKLTVQTLFGNMVQHTSVTQCTVVALEKNKGFKRAVKIIIKLKPEHSNKHDELLYLKSQLQHILTNQSVACLPFEIEMK